MTDLSALSAIMKSVMTKEGNAILAYAEKSDPDLVRAAELINANRGPLIVSGVGKSGHIAKKIGSTMRSLGKPAAFLHAAEASHGDLGIIHADSTVLILSNSGETTELSDLLHYCRNYKISVICITGNKDSTLARFSDIVLSYGKISEACINGLAPTTTTTLCLAIGDALAVAVSHLNSIQPEDFRRWHPGGKLGSRLNYVRDLMKTGSDLPLVRPEASITEALIKMSEKSFGSVIVTDGKKVLGLVTDGDMRRNVQHLANSTILDIATLNPVYIGADELASKAAEVMSSRGITTCIVGQPGAPIEGYVSLHDCIAAGQAK